MVITRFAPSPTGHLHIGGLRTALFNYLYARSCGGKFYLRIEDTDLDRNVQEATEAILKAFEWVGLEVDGEIWYQSQRLDIYKGYIQQLLDEGKAYYCYMSKEELEALRETQRAQGLTPRYDRRYRDFKGTPPSGIEPVVRIKAPLSGEVHFKDGVKGEVCVQAEELDDFVIARSNGVPTYNFVVTIDDALMGISDVIRGDDHLSNTPKQIILYQALGFKIPNFYHVPMILNESGHKLSKRDGAMGVMDYKALGYLKDALLNFLVRLGWSHNDQEIFSLQEMKEFFNPKDLNSAPSCFSPHKLEWLNSHYLKESSVDRLKALLADFNLPSNFYALSPAQQNTLLEALKSRVSTLKEMAIEIAKVLNTPTSYALNKLKNRDQALEVLKTLMAGLKEQDFSSVESLDATLHAFMADSRLKAGALMLPLRIALLGEAGGIGVKEALFILGYKMSLERLKAFLAL
ncbi:Glutamyl-tRNA synthetase [Helicobacter heilmannii]|uniref:glutamate--tRNA ligase n=1 Tax=Helicobacter heilmannii TaxID=35817 RepID=UPI0006A05877|nr:glutamate--tRNA ligase [Helicobacter heilmannii]CRF47338.1 Glutamyl-tRNA synthetase [Helicobacter heilmannii]